MIKSKFFLAAAICLTIIPLLVIDIAKHRLVLMPRYLIIDKKGGIVETNASLPSSRNSLYAQLDKYLSQN
jgi:hypothetical protein